MQEPRIHQSKKLKVENLQLQEENYKEKLVWTKQKL